VAPARAVSAGRFEARWTALVARCGALPAAAAVTVWIGSAAAARASGTRAAGRPGEGEDRTAEGWTVATTGAAACWTVVTGAATPDSGPFASATPAEQAASTQATTTVVEMLPRHGQARLALINIRG
jgi:hypothetical protein